MTSQHTPSVFTPAFLEERMQRDDESTTAAEAIYAGPWRVVAQDQDFTVQQSFDHGPAKVRFRDRELALLSAAILPILGRTRQFRLCRRDQEMSGFDVQTIIGGRLETVGWLRYDHPDLLDALHIAEWLLRSPAALAFVLEAASGDVLVRAGKILAAR